MRVGMGGFALAARTRSRAASRGLAGCCRARAAASRVALRPTGRRSAGGSSSVGSWRAAGRRWAPSACICARARSLRCSGVLPDLFSEGKLSAGARKGSG
jgi:hypothetical protein